MNEKIEEFFKISRFWLIVGVILVLGIIGAVCYGGYYKDKYVSLSATIEAARGSELERKLESVNAELERTKTALTRSEQSVAELEGIDRQRDAGITRIERSLDATGTAIKYAQSGNARTEAALRGIQELSFILEAEFGRGTDQR